MDPVAEIKHLYYNTTRTTVQRDITRAVELLKTLTTDDARESVAVYMDGLSQMRSEWGVRPDPAYAPGSNAPKAVKPRR